MNTFFEEQFWGCVFIVIAILSVIAIGFAMVKFEQNSDLCTSQGGTLIETSKGYSCAKVEKIDLRKAQEK
jgi:L-asparagine transporter-like permease